MRDVFRLRSLLAVAVVVALATALSGCTTQKPANSGSSPSSDSSSSTATNTADSAPVKGAVSAEEATPAPSAPSEATAQEFADGNFGTFAPVSGSGKGPGFVKVPVGATGAIVSATHKGKSNFAIEGVGADNKPTGLLVNTAGNYRGVTMFTSDVKPVKLKVTADGTWTLKISPVSSASKATSSNSGTGDAVLLYDGAAASWNLTHAGSADFSVRFLSMEADSVVVNKTGKFSGTVSAPAGPAVVIVGANGKWTMVAR